MSLSKQPLVLFLKTYNIYSMYSLQIDTRPYQSKVSIHYWYRIPPNIYTPALINLKSLLIPYSPKYIHTRPYQSKVSIHYWYRIPPNIYTPALIKLKSLLIPYSPKYIHTRPYQSKVSIHYWYRIPPNIGTPTRVPSQIMPLYMIDQGNHSSLSCGFTDTCTTSELNV